MMRDTLISRPDLAPAAVYYTLACAASRAHSDLASAALTAYGDQGPQISGCVRAHFPEPIKNVLRQLARSVTEACERAEALRPPSVHIATMRRLSRAIATRDGAGFYGPQPVRNRKESK